MPLDVLNSGRALLLLVVANSAPWAAGRVLRARWAVPLDLGCVLRDGERLFGSHKTWRGLIAGVLACALAAQLSGVAWTIGAGFGAASLLGDAASSAIKRRLQLSPGVEVLGLDQIPEALLPLVIFAPLLGLGVVDVAAVVVSFVLLDVLVTRLRH
jgi:CDP-2,3-bis-(O-geranylgeranyl)-sn-glycerol synthase